MIPSFPWLELVDVRPAKAGDWIVNSRGASQWCGDETGCPLPIVRPANIYGVYRLEDIKIPEGWEPDGETMRDAYRRKLLKGYPVAEEYFFQDGQIFLLHSATENSTEFRLFVRRVKTKTKKVLVVEYDEPNELLVDSFMGASKVFTTKVFTNSRARIEERPL